MELKDLRTDSVHSKTRSSLLWIHYMELKETQLPSQPYQIHLNPESITWSWKPANPGRRGLDRPARIHYMELKDPSALWHLALVGSLWFRPESITWSWKGRGMRLSVGNTRLESITWSWKVSIKHVYLEVHDIMNPLHGVESQPWPLCYILPCQLLPNPLHGVESNEWYHISLSCRAFRIHYMELKAPPWATRYKPSEPRPSWIHYMELKDSKPGSQSPSGLNHERIHYMELKVLLSVLHFLEDGRRIHYMELKAGCCPGATTRPWGCESITWSWKQVLRSLSQRETLESITWSWKKNLYAPSVTRAWWWNPLHGVERC